MSDFELITAAEQRRLWVKKAGSTLFQILITVIYLGSFYYLAWHDGLQSPAPLPTPVSVNQALPTAVGAPVVNPAQPAVRVGREINLSWFFTWLPFIVIILCLAVGEEWFARRWRPTYFHYGLPLFSRWYKLGVRSNLVAGIQTAAGKLGGEIPIEFRVLNQQECLFLRQPPLVYRNRGFWWPLHGYIRYEQGAKAIQVKAYTNWSVVLLVLLIGVMVLPMMLRPLPTFPAFAYWEKGLILLTFCFICFAAWRSRQLCDQLGHHLAQ